MSPTANPTAPPPLNGHCEHRESDVRLTSFLHYPASLVLIAAGILKSHEMLSATEFDALLFESKSLTALFALFEIWVGCWVLVTRRQRCARYLLVGLFAAFTAYSLYGLYDGRLDCGCFGAIRVPPRLTVIIDFLALAAVFFWCPRRWVPRSRMRRVTLAGGGMFLVFFSVTVFATSVAGWWGERAEAESVVFLRVDEWVGERYPLVGVDPRGEERVTGHWTLLVVDLDCAACQSLIRSMPEGGSRGRYGILAISRSDHSLDWVTRRGHRLSHLPDDRRWMAKTPAIVELRDGIVTHVNLQPGDNPW